MSIDGGDSLGQLCDLKCCVLLFRRATRVSGLLVIYVAGGKPCEATGPVGTAPLSHLASAPVDDNGVLFLNGCFLVGELRLSLPLWSGKLDLGRWWAPVVLGLLFLKKIGSFLTPAVPLAHSFTCVHWGAPLQLCVLLRW